MTLRGKLRRGHRRLICRLIGHDWDEWEWRGAFHVGDPQYRECQRCPKMEWR